MISWLQQQYTGVNSATDTICCRVCSLFKNVFDLTNLRLSFGYIVDAGGPEHEVARSPNLFAIFL